MPKIFATLVLSGVALGTLSGCAGLFIGSAAAVGLAAHDRRTTGTVVEDQAIEVKARALFREQAYRLARSHINITSYNNSVLLSGEVETPDIRQWAEDSVRRIDKVKEVYNELLVGVPSPFGMRSNDGWITTKVKSSLVQINDIPNFDPTRVKVVTERGIVYLMGLVSQREGEAATSVARQVSGVQQVVKLFEYMDASS